MNKLPRTQFEQIAAWSAFVFMVLLMSPFIRGFAAILGWRWSLIDQLFVDYFMLTVMIPFGVSMFMLRIAKRRGRKQVIEHNYIVCTNCRYPLKSHPEHGRCPECGTAYSADILQMRWQNAYAHKQVTLRDWLPF